MNARPSEIVSVGDAFSAVVVERLTRTQIVQYAGASGDFNPLHSDEIFAVETAHNPSIFAHGMLTMALSAKAVTDRFGPAAVLRLGGRFVSQVWPGDTLTTLCRVTAVLDREDAPEAELELTTTNAAGAVVFTGAATVRLPAEGLAQT